MSTRTDLARRLELTGVQELGDLVTGRARGMTVSLQGETPFTGCVVELAAALPIAHLVMRPGDLNHPDAVETGDAIFDERMQVTALSGYAPTLQNLLSEKKVRRAVLKFFQRHPEAAFIGSKLHVPSVGGVTQELLVDALALAETVAERFATIGFVETEHAPDLPAGARSRSFVPTLIFGAGLGGILFVFAVGLLGLKADIAGVLVAALCFIFGLMGATFLGSLELEQD